MPLSPHLSHLHKHHPQWYKHASPHQRHVLKQRTLASYRASRAVAKALEPVQPIEAFCRPLLEDALPRWYPGATLPPLDNTLLWSQDDQRDLTWLEAALQNFDDGAKVKLYQDDDSSTPLDLDTKVFVSGVRNLDLGQRYQYHLADHVDNEAFRDLVRAQDRAAFAAELTTARLQGHLDPLGETLGEAALSDTRQVTVDGQQRTLYCGYLSLFGIPLDGPLVLRLDPLKTSETCVLYLPGHRRQAMRQYSSFKALSRALTQALWKDDERRLFTRYVDQARQPEFASKLHDALYPSYPYATVQASAPTREKDAPSHWTRRLFPAPTDLWQETLDKNARLPLTFTSWKNDCFTKRARTHVQRKLHDAAAVAVPVAQRDRAALLASISGWLGLGMSVLNIAALFVPALGEVMMVIGGAQLLGEFLDGVHAANEGDAEAAIEQLFDVLENLAQVAVLGAAGAFVETPGALHEWHPVTQGNRQRLWPGDLSPFSRPAPWPEGTLPAADGLHHWQGKAWLDHQGKACPLERDGHGGWRLGKGRGHQHQPQLLGNDQGAWLLPHERPLSWDTPQLLQRVGPVGAGLDQQALERALRCSGYDATNLRMALVDHQPLPALLADSFETLGAKVPGSLPPLPGSEVLQRDFPSLSRRACNEIVASADPADLARLHQKARVPLKMADTARVYQREARINRALAGLQQSAGASADRDALALGLLEHLPGWSGDVRLELREDGQLVHAAGAEGKQLKIIVRKAGQYEPRDERDQVLANLGDLFQAILQALPDSERVALKLQVHDAPGLCDALFELAVSDRRRAAHTLGMVPIRPMYRLPTRLPGNRRIGYRLSGRGRGWLSEDQLFDQLYPASPTADREVLRAALRAEAGPRPGAFGRLLERLRGEYRQLDQSLQRWVHDPDNVRAGTFEQRRIRRGVVANRIRQAWRRESEPDVAANINHVCLRIHGQYLDELPTLPVQLPHVRELSVQDLEPSVDPNHFLLAFPQVRHLNLGNSTLAMIPESVALMSHLQTLDLSGALLDLDAPGQLAILGRLTRLTYLNFAQALQALSVASLESLAQLPELRVFQADLNELELGAEHFQALQRWPALSELYLGQNQIELDEATRTALAGLNRLRRLSLYENPLDFPPDVTGWTQLEWLDLEYTGIAQWPIGLQGLLEQQPLVLRRLELNRNALSDAPDLRNSSFAMAVRAGDQDILYTFDENPFTDAARNRLQDAGLSTHTLPDSPPQWSAGWPDRLLDHIALTYPDPQWRPLYDLMERLPDTADFLRHPPAMRQRMQRVLEALAGDGQGSTDGGWGRAQVQQHIIDTLNDAAMTCVDQASLLFQQVETEVTVWQTVIHATPGLADERVAIDSATALLRQQQLDTRIAELYNARVARRRALGEAVDQADRDAAPPLHSDDDLSDAELTEPNYLLDEVEMALHARIHLRNVLRLPPQPDEISFDYLARLSEATLARLADAVSLEADGQRLVDWAVDQGFWAPWVRRLRPQAYEALAERWSGASEYFDSFSEAAPLGAYRGPAVAAEYVAALERELGDVQGLAWQIDGVLQRIDLVSNRYPDENAVYQRAAQLLLSSRQAAEAALLRELTEAMIADLLA
ncbi:dermonecrotic toxin domain-containing protein [Pseudomonas sp. UFMG81]|uniref:dermonecrotic toxin domain-containing protein n=1 Tax=Pseudomonas sp. UFMG81 TaxID=2745936 RepID=UPI0018903F4D|nr:DUF6543 domain-containing protein [Pseudomonas sp. UFMG81]